jgi:multidrug efflux pump
MIEAIVLVVLVMFVFLQSWRATLIPVIAVPVVLLGTFCVLNLLGYSINTLTMFAMVLSIGLLVDDAIVVVENVERLMRDEHLSPLDATIRSMKEITSALIGIAVVLSAVFLPMAFFPGSTGVIYRQFSVTIVASMLLSVFVALTVTPAMCASLLRGHHNDKPRRGPLRWLHRGVDRTAGGYQGAIARMLRTPFRWLVPYAAIVGAMALLLTRLPPGFLPNEDQGVARAIWTLPAGASLSRTEEVARTVQRHYLETEKRNVKSLFTISAWRLSSSSTGTSGRARTTPRRRSPAARSPRCRGSATHRSSRSHRRRSRAWVSPTTSTSSSRRSAAPTARRSPGRAISCSTRRRRTAGWPRSGAATSPRRRSSRSTSTRPRRSRTASLRPTSRAR